MATALSSTPLSSTSTSIESLHGDALDDVVAAAASTAAIVHFAFTCKRFHNTIFPKVKQIRRSEYARSLGECMAMPAAVEAFNYLARADLEPFFCGVFAAGNRAFLQALTDILSTDEKNRLSTDPFLVRSLRELDDALGHKLEPHPSFRHSFHYYLFRTFYDYSVEKEHLDFLKWVVDERICEAEYIPPQFVARCACTKNWELAKWAIEVSAGRTDDYYLVVLSPFLFLD